MERKFALLSVCFCSGLLGALANSLTAWLCGSTGITAIAGVQIAPALTPQWLYPRLVWGGIWGMVYFLSVGRNRSRRQWIRKGLWVSLLPTAVQLVYIFPHRAGLDYFGLQLGLLTPLFVLLFNAVWGFFTGLFTRLLWGR